jgi:hypothetical protein
MKMANATKYLTSAPDNFSTQDLSQQYLTAIILPRIDTDIVALHQLWYAISLVIGSIFIGALLSGMLELIKSSSGKSNLFGKSRPNDQLGEKYALGFAVLISMLIVYELIDHAGRKSKRPPSD